MAKIKGLLRRSYGEYAAVQSSKLLDIAGLVLSYDTYTLEWQGNSMELTKRELTLLEMLMKQPGKAVSRETLLEGLWDDVLFVDDNTLSVNVTRVRKKLQDLGLSNVIETVRGVGYKLNITWR
jgi:two-component system OmpR family response regulator